MVVDGKWHEIKIQRKGIAVQMTVGEYGRMDTVVDRGLTSLQSFR